jgi:hypothetical protein
MMLFDAAAVVEIVVENLYVSVVVVGDGIADGDVDI